MNEYAGKGMEVYLPPGDPGSFGPALLITTTPSGIYDKIVLEE
jgi:hypothetical protein